MHQEPIPREPAAAVGRFSSRGGGAQGVAPIPSLCLGGSSLGRAVSVSLLESCTRTGEGWFGLGFCSLFREGASEGEATTTYVIFRLIRVKSVFVCSGNLLNI